MGREDLGDDYNEVIQDIYLIIRGVNNPGVVSISLIDINSQWFVRVR